MILVIELQAREEGHGGSARRHVPRGARQGCGTRAGDEGALRDLAADAGCEHFEVFQSVSDPDKLVLLELWKDQAALDAHAKLQAQRPSLPEGLRLGAGEREDYTHSRTR